MTISQNTQGASILVVDDDEIILIALAETLRHDGYNPTTTKSPCEAVRLLEKNHYSVIISDQRMAEMTGLEFLKKASEIQPNASRILITGVLTLKTIIEAINTGEIYRFIAKPWLREDLLATIRNAVQRHDLLETNVKLQTDTLRLNEKLSQANSMLQQKIRELTVQREEITQTHALLQTNFAKSLDLVQRIVSVYHPALADETQQTVRLCDAIIEQSDMKPRERQILRIAARLHNIGQISISRDLLIKARSEPKNLSPEDRKNFENSAIYGQMLADYIDDDVGTTIRACRERMDGSGYPDGLVGDAIPRPARILSAVIWYLETEGSQDERLEELLHCSGKTFTDEAVGLLLKAVRNIPASTSTRKVDISEATPGMVLAKGIYSPSGMLILPEGQKLTENTIEQMRHRNLTGVDTDNLFVYS